MVTLMVAFVETTMIMGLFLLLLTMMMLMMMSVVLLSSPPTPLLMLVQPLAMLETLETWTTIVLLRAPFPSLAKKEQGDVSANNAVAEHVRIDVATTITPPLQLPINDELFPTISLDVTQMH